MTLTARLKEKLKHATKQIGKAYINYWRFMSQRDWYLTILFLTSLDTGPIFTAKNDERKPQDLQFLDSPGASFRSQNNIFGCVESKHRPSSPVSNNARDKLYKYTQINYAPFVSILIAYQHNPAAKKHASDEIVSNLLREQSLYKKRSSL